MSLVGPRRPSGSFRKAGQRIVVRLKDDLFAEMPYERANEFVGKRLEFLNGLAEESGRRLAGVKAHLTFVRAALATDAV